MSARARRGRFKELLRRFPALSDMRVLDLGGVPNFWRVAPVRPRSVTLLNLMPASADEAWLDPLVGDACDPDNVLGKDRFDLVVSNSVIEHVGGHARRQQLADVIHSRSDQHWVQTPNRYFPVEPHWLAPGFQFLPLGLRARAIQRWPLKHCSTLDREAAMRVVMGVELITTTELRFLFPESTIWKERLAGVPKSLVAIKALDSHGG